MTLLLLLACAEEPAGGLERWDVPVRDVGPIGIEEVIEDAAGRTWFEWSRSGAISRYDEDADVWRTWFADELGGAVAGIYRDGRGYVCVVPSNSCHTEGGWTQQDGWEFVRAASWSEDAGTGDGLLRVASSGALQLYRITAGTPKPLRLEAPGTSWAHVGGGAVWAGPYGGGALSRFAQNGGREVVSAPAERWVPTAVDARGRLWVSTAAGLLRWDGEWTSAQPPTSAPLERVHVTASGVVWVLATDFLWRLDSTSEGAWTKVSWPEVGPLAVDDVLSIGDNLLFLAAGQLWRADTWVTAVTPAVAAWKTKSAVWVSTEEGVLARLEGPELRTRRVVSPPPYARSLRIWNSTGSWMAGGEGVGCLGRFRADAGLGLGWVESTLFAPTAASPGFAWADQASAVTWCDGLEVQTAHSRVGPIEAAVQTGEDLWVATRRAGVARIHRCTPGSRCRKRYEAPADSIAVSGESFWLADEASVRHVSIPDRDVLTLPGVGAVGLLLGDGEGGVWLTTEGDWGLALRHLNERGQESETVQLYAERPDQLHLVNGRPWLVVGEHLRAVLAGGVRQDYDLGGIRASVRQWISQRLGTLAESGSGRVDPTPDGRLWIEVSQGLAFLRWHDNVPDRPSVVPEVEAAPVIGAVNPTTPEEVWRSRPGAVIRTAPDTQLPELYAQRDVFPALAIEPFARGEAWISFGPGGVAHAKGGELTYLDELAHDGRGGGVLDLSLVPGDPDGTAFVATQTGVARIARKGGRTEVTWLPEVGIPGPVDHVLAVDRDTVLVGLDAIDAALFPNGLVPLHRTKDGFATRTTSRLVRLRTHGTSELVRVLDSGLSILDMAADPGDDRVWVATTAGLYCLDERDPRVFWRITAQGTLAPAPLHTLTVAPDGTVWAAVDGQGDAPATVVGYRPDTDTVRTYTPDDGLPKADRIDFLDLRSDGWLVAGTNAGVVKGQVFVPGLAPEQQRIVVALVAFSLIGGIATTATIIRVSARRAARRAQLAKLAPTREAAAAFFRGVGRTVRPLDDTRLEATDPKASPARVLVHCTAEERVPVEVVQAAFAATPPDADGKRPLAFLVHPLELDPAAWRQLDVYRLRENAVVIPLSVPFATAALAEGSPRPALDGLLRRYLGFQDLFDTRTAVDEARFFYGRRALLSEVRAVLSRGGHVALVGARKAGKTSVLMQLRQHFSSFPVVKVDLQSFSRTNPRWPTDLLAEILRRYDVWGRARHGAAWSPAEVPEPTGVTFQHALVERRDLRAARGDTLPLVLLLDEVERVFPTEDPAHVERWVEATGALRAVAQEGAGLLSIVAADLRPTFTRVNQLGAATNPFYRFFQVQVLPTLDAPECDAMLSEIGQAMGLDLLPPVREVIYADSGGHPSLARQLASAACRQRGDAAHVGLDAYTKAIVWVRDGEGELDNFFEENLWAPSTPLERRVLLAAADDDGATDAQLEAGLDPDALSALRDARRMLAAMGLLADVDGRWRINGRLFRAWLAERSERAA